MFIPMSKDRKINEALNKLYQGKWIYYPPTDNSGMWRAEVEINDICSFRIEMDVSEGFEQSELFMEVELIFFDCINA